MEKVKNASHCDEFLKENIIDNEEVRKKLNYVHEGLRNTSKQTVLLATTEGLCLTCCMIASYKCFLNSLNVKLHSCKEN